MTGDTVTLIMKATRRCNLRCVYCGDWQTTSGSTMGFPVVARTIQRALREYARVEFIWHGGESALLPISFYKKVMLMQGRFRRPDQVIGNTFQTNATLIDEEWARFLRDARFAVGFSIDGPPEVHNRTRPYINGMPSFDDVSRGMAILRQYGLLDSCILVVGREVLALGADRVFDFFQQIGIRSYSCLAVKPTIRPGESGPKGYPTDSQGVSSFMCRLYDCWLEHGDREIRIRELAAIRDRLCGKEARVCNLSGACIGRYFCVEPNGDVTHCDCFVGGQYPLGNIMDSSFADMAASASMAKLLADNRRSLDLTRVRCGDFELTRGGCPHSRLTALQHGRDSGPCCEHRDLIAHTRARMADEQVVPTCS